MLIRSGFRLVKAYNYKLQPQGPISKSITFNHQKSRSTRYLSNNTTKKSSNQTSYFNIKTFAKAVKIIRLPTILFCVYKLGYEEGVIERAYFTEEQEIDLLKSIIIQSTGEDVNGVKIHIDSTDAMVDEPRIFMKNDIFFRVYNKMVLDERLYRVSSIMKRILPRSIEKTKEFADRAAANYLKNLTEEERTRLTTNHELCVQELMEKDSEYERWVTKLEDLQGEWMYILIDSPEGNAFVTDVVPRTIFFTTGLLENLIRNDDELAFVLSHEMSHLIHGHTTISVRTNALLHVIEIILLTLDPTEGGLSLFSMSLLSSIKSLFESAFSRQHEREADTLGIELTAKANFDAFVGAKFFRTLDLSESGIEKSALMKYFRSHPTSEERYDYIIEECRKYKKAERLPVL